MKPASVAGFRFLKTNSATSVPKKYITFRPPVLKKVKARWYVEYWYRVPEELKPQFKNRDWHRFRVFEDINRYKSEEYARELVDAITHKLEQGFNPFQRPEELSITSSEWSLNRALDEYIIYNREKGLRGKSITTYSETVRIMKEYFQADNVIFLPASSITKAHIKEFITAVGKQRKWKNSTYNKRLANVRTLFNWLLKEGHITTNPAIAIDARQTVVTRHQYFEKDILAAIKTKMEKTDRWVLSFLEFLYFTCTRPKSETRLLKIEHILFDRHMLYIPGDISKNKKGDYIPMDPDLESKLQHLRKYPASHFIWGKKGPDKKPASHNYFASRFKPYKDELGLGENYTMYGLKHTRAIDLANAGVDPYSIMKLMRHSGLDVTMKYLRDLGCEVDFSKYNIEKRF
jgi:site-specific recombinase XerD